MPDLIVILTLQKNYYYNFKIHYMKKAIYLLISGMVCSSCIAQNLVTNGDFEMFTTCPYGYGQIDYAASWTKPTTGGTSDYFNQCAPAGNYVDVPVNLDCSSYQAAHSGDGYAAIINYSDNGADYREYIEATLNAPLASGTCYQFEMYVNLVNCCKYAADGLGIYFSNTSVTAVNTANTLPYTPQISNAPFNYYCTDTAGWVSFSGTYTAQGGENYLIIGNFNDDQNTNKYVVNNSPFYPNNFIYIDDVSLSVCTGIHEYGNDALKIYPDPVSGKLNVFVNANEPSEIILYDLSSKKLLQQKFTNSVSFSTAQFAPGIYFVEVIVDPGLRGNGKKSYCRKIIVE
jgi:type IX secretion system substrate protein